MGRNRKRTGLGRAEPPAAAPAAVPEATRSRRAPLALLAAVLVALAIGAVLYFSRGASSPAPPSRPAAAAAPDYVGGKACGECHAKEQAAWTVTVDFSDDAVQGAGGERQLAVPPSVGFFQVYGFFDGLQAIIADLQLLPWFE